MIATYACPVIGFFKYKLYRIIEENITQKHLFGYNALNWRSYCSIIVKYLGYKKKKMGSGNPNSRWKDKKTPQKNTVLIIY
jgi:hypothetical protein